MCSTESDSTHSKAGWHLEGLSRPWKSQCDFSLRSSTFLTCTNLNREVGIPYMCKISNFEELILTSWKVIRMGIN